MEWQGINLTASHQNKWVKRAKRNIIGLVVGISIASFISVVCYFFYLQKREENKPLVLLVQNLKQEVSLLENKINQQKSLVKNESQKIIGKHEIQQFITLLKAMPLKNGGVEKVLFYIEDKAKMEINGLVDSQLDFKQLKEYIDNANQWETITDEFKVSDENKVYFKLQILAKE